MQELPQENFAGSCEQDLTNWPSKGEIQFNNVVAKYQEDQDDIVKKVSFTASPGTFLSVVGRNGSGKSTLLNTITRLIELESGQILIDGIDISSVPLELLRSKVTVIS